MKLYSGILTITAFASAVLFPWPLTVLLALAASFFEPLAPLAVGLFADTLYYAPGAGSLPVYTLYGLLVSGISLFVHSRLRTGSMK